jgi:HEAT repeat protein
MAVGVVSAQVTRIIMGRLAEIAMGTAIVAALTGLPSAALSQDASAEFKRAGNDLGSKDPATRAKAAATLGQMGKDAAPAVPALIRHLSDEAEVFSGVGFGKLVLGKNTTVSDVVANALGQIGDSRAVSPLYDLMLNQSKRGNWLARKSAAEALGQIGDAKAVPSLLRAMSDTIINDAAVESLVKIGEPAVKPLVDLATTARGNARW